MSRTPYITAKLEGLELQVPQTDKIPVSLSYALEDDSDFRIKKSGTALDIIVPATPGNAEKCQEIYNPSAEDTLPGIGLNKPLDVILIAAGRELMTGKAFILSGKKTGGKPDSFRLNVFGDNADWVIPLKETTLQQCMSAVTHTFDKATIEDSWNYDGSNEAQSFVYPPVRYREAFGIWTGGDAPDMIYRPDNMRAALFLYWILWRGFKLAGYKIQSTFMDSEYFRRVTVPWVWGNFWYVTDKMLKDMGFLATSPLTPVAANPGVTGTPISWQFKSLSGTGSSTVNDFARWDATAGAEEKFKLDNVTSGIGYIGNPLSYSYNPSTGQCTWEYLTAYASLGVLTCGFEVKLTGSIDVSFDSNANVDYEIFHNATLVQTISNVWAASAPTLGTDEDSGERITNFFVPNLNPGDTVTLRVKYHCFKSTFGFCFLKIYVSGDGIQPDPTPGGAPTIDTRGYFKLAYIRRQLGSIIDFRNYDRLSNFKFLDLLRGVIDTFNLQMDTDPLTKTVIIEPTHNFSTDANTAARNNPGYYNGNVVDWTNKEDASDVQETEIFQDFEREVIMRMKDDPNDGILKLLQDRHQSSLTGAKFVFPERFKKGGKDIENRFFSGVSHYFHDKWKDITGVSPQLICLIPENISNTSNPESESTFAPKLAYYKGLVDRNTYGGWNWDGDTSQDLPLMFAVNYRAGGEGDPILTYCDQRIEDGAGGFVIGQGLFKRFFWQRFAIMRHGKKYNSNFHLINSDVIDTHHREFKVIQQQRYQLIAIERYQPMLEKSTACRLWKWYPISQWEAENTFPSETSVLTSSPVPATDDIKYAPLIAFVTDIPQ